MRGYLKIKKGVAVIVTPEGDYILDSNPPPKYLNHIVEYDKKTNIFTLDRKYGD